MGADVDTRTSHRTAMIAPVSTTAGLSRAPARGTTTSRGRDWAAPRRRDRRDRGRARRLGAAGRPARRRDVARRRGRPGRRRPPATRRQGLRRRPVRHQRQARPRAVHRRRRARPRRRARHRRPSPVHRSPSSRSSRSASSGSSPRSAIRSRRRRWPRSRRQRRSGSVCGSSAGCSTRPLPARRLDAGRRLGPAGRRDARLVAPLVHDQGGRRRCRCRRDRGRRAQPARAAAHRAGRQRGGHPAGVGHRPGLRSGRGPLDEHRRPDPDRHAQRPLLPDRHGAPDARASTPRPGRSGSTAWSTARPR